jgi:hypothetical protein
VIYNVGSDHGDPSRVTLEIMADLSLVLRATDAHGRVVTRAVEADRLIDAVTDLVVRRLLAGHGA